MKLDPRNPMRSALMSVLIFEVIVFWLGYAGMVQVSDVAPLTGALWTAAATLLVVAGVWGLRRGWGYYPAWAGQVAGVLLGLLTPWMYAMGGVFALIWVMSFVLGKRLEANRK